MGNAFRGEASFDVEGKAYRVRYSWNAAAEYEEAAAKPLSDALLDIAREKLAGRAQRAHRLRGLLRRLGPPPGR